MTAATAITATDTVTYQGDASPAAPHAADGMSFMDLLSDLNPLQYLPVVGTIYRAVTGDIIPKPLREAGSLVVSGLMGGPIGLATNLAMLAVEKVTGFDPEDTAQALLAEFSPAQAAGPASTAAQTPPVLMAQAASPPGPDVEPAPAQPWTPAQLAAYGVVTLSNGELRQGAVTGADVLNGLQLLGGSGRTLAA